MTKHEALKLMRLVSAMEYWMMAQGKVVPDYLIEDTEGATKMLEREILGPDSWPEMKDLDIGTGGYLDLGTDLADEALSRLPKGRHALVIAGTYGIDGYIAAPTTQPAPQQEAQELRCNPHPKAPHGFARNSSHSAHRYVCECESWEPYDAGYNDGFQAGLKAEQALCELSDQTQEMEAQPRKAVNLTGEEVGMLTVFDGLHHVETPLLAEFIRAIEQAVLKANGVEQ